MKTSSRRYKGNVEEDVKVIKGITIFNLVFILIIVIGAAVGISILVNYIMAQMALFESLSSQIPDIPQY